MGKISFTQRGILFMNLKIIAAKLIFSATLLTTTAVFSDEPVKASIHPIQEVGPVRTYNAELPGERVKPSAINKLQPGQRLDIPYVTPIDSWIIQKLTERSYWILSDQFAVTVFVGDRGVLLIDAPDVFQMDLFVKELKSITPLPVTTIVYSHPHIDHVGNADELSAIMQSQGITVRIIASENSVREIERYKHSVEPPTEVIANGHSHFTFENWTFKYVTPVDWAHTGADSYTITPDGVLHIADFFFPGRLPLTEVSGVQNMTGWIEFCRYVAGDQDWVFANLGHANIGYRKDVLTTLDYFKDLYSNGFKVFKGFKPVDFQNFKGQNTAVMIRLFFDGAATQLTQLIAERWSHYPQWEVARDHAAKVLWDMALNYNYHENIQPDFAPIPAP